MHCGYLLDYSLNVRLIQKYYVVYLKRTQINARIKSGECTQVCHNPDSE